MNLLLDTHIAIWALNDDSLLSRKARALILDPDNTLYYSTVSVWEVCLKHAKRPEEIPFTEKDFSEACQEAGFLPLNLIDKHILGVCNLNRSVGAKEHNDPFDRLLLSQAVSEKMTFMTHDILIADYTEKCIVLV